MADQAAQLFRQVLTPLAERFGLDYNLEMLGEGRPDAVAAAFRFLPVGASLLVLYAEPPDFPASSRRGRRRGAKWLRRAFATAGGQRATVFLTHAMGIYLADAMRRAREQESADAHLSLVDLLGRHYPLDENEQRELDRACQRLERDETALDELTGGAPRAADAEGRVWAAQDLFRCTVMVNALRLALDPQRFDHLAPELTIARPDTSYDGIVRMRKDAGWWTDTAARWTDAARLALA